jgi:hypothetical protein
MDALPLRPTHLIKSLFFQLLMIAVMLMIASHTSAQTWTGSTSNDWYTASNWSGGVPTASSDVTIPAGTTNPVLINSSQTFVQAKSLTVNSGATITIDINGAIYITETIDINGSVTGAGTIVANGTSNQNVKGTMSNFTNNNASQTVYASGNLVVSSTFVNISTGKMDFGSYTLSGPSTVTNVGIIYTKSTAYPPLPTGKTWGGTVTYNGTAGGSYVVGGTYNNLMFTNTSNFNLAIGNIYVDGTLTTTSGGTLDMSTYLLYGNLSTINNNGVIRTSSMENPALAFGKTWGGTIEYAVTTGGQILGYGTYNNIKFLNTSGMITLYDATTITVNGTLTTSAGGTLRLGSAALAGTTSVSNAGIITTVNTSGAPIPAGKTWGGTVDYNNPTGGQTIVAGTYNNLTMSNTSGTQNTGGALTVNGIFTTTSGGVLNMGGNTLGANIVNHSGILNTSNTSPTPIPSSKTWGGTVQYTSTSGGQTVAGGTYNNLIFTNTSGINTASGAIQANGDFTVPSGTILNMASYRFLGVNGTMSMNGTLKTANTEAVPIPTTKTWGGTVEYTNTTGGQYVSNGTYNNLTLSNISGTASAWDNLTINGTLTTTAGGVLSMGTYTLSGTLSIITNNGTISTANTSPIPIPAGRTWGGTVTYKAASGAQTIMQGTYNNLTMGNTSGTQTASGDITLNGTLTNPSGSTLVMGTNALSGASSIISNSGTITTANVSATPALPAGKTWGGTVTYNATTGGQSVAGGTYNNLNLSNTSGTQTANGAITISNGGALTTTAGGTFSMSANALSETGTATFTNNGVITTANTSATPALPAGKIWGGTVTYNATTGAQSVAGGTYNNLNVSNTSGTQTANGTITISNGGTLSTTAGGTLSMSTYALSETGTATFANGGTITTANTSATPALPSGKTWLGTIIYNAAGGNQKVGGGTYNNLTLNNTSGSQTAIGSITMSNGGTLTVIANGTLNMDTAVLRETGTATFTNNGTITTANTSATPLPSRVWTIGTISYNAAAGGQTVMATTYNNLILANTSGTQTANGVITIGNGGTLTTTADGTLSMGTNLLSETGTTTFTNNGTITTANTSTTPLPNKTWSGTINYNAASGSQTVMTTTYNNLTMGNTSGAQTAAGNLTVNGTLTINSGAKLDMAAYQLTGTLSSISNSGFIETANTSTTPLPTGKTWNGTVIYKATTGGQHIVSATSYNNLTLSNNNGFQTSDANLNVTGNLTNTNTNSILDMGTNTLAVSGTISNTGTVQTANTSSSPLPTGKTWDGWVTYNSTSGNQHIVSATSYNNLTLANTSGTQIADANITVNGNFATYSGGKLDMGTNTLSVNTVGVHNGTILTQNTSATPISAGKIWGGTVEYNAPAGNQHIVSATSYRDLILSNTSGTQTSDANLTLTGNLTNTNTNGILDMSTYTLAVTGTITNNGSIQTANTSPTPLPTGKTWSGTIEYTSASAQTIVSANSYATLKISGGGTKTLAASTTVNTDLNLFAGDLSIAANTLTIGGTVSGSGTLTGSASSNLTINGSASNAALSFTQTSAATRSLNNLTLSRSNGATLSNALEVINTVDVTVGTLASGGNLTLISTNSNTARIAALSGGASVSGNVNAQRFILGGVGRRKYRYLSSPVNLSGSYNLDQFIDDVTITGSGAGYDALTVTPSAFIYDETMAGTQNTGFVTPATTSTPIGIGKGVAIFYRGPRGQSGEFLAATVPNDATFDVVGTVNSGDISPTLSYTNTGAPLDDGWNLVGNPYPSQIDWDSPNWTKTNISNVISLYNPATGTYGTYNGTIGTNGATQYIALGQGFFVQATGANPVLTFRENVKVPNTPSNMFRTNEGDPQLVRLMMYKDENNSDEAIVLFGEQASKNYNDNEDALKFFNSTINIYTKSKDQYNLVINSTSFPLASDTIDIVISGAAGAYQLRVSEIASLDQNIHVFVVDHFTNQITAITSNEMSIPFNITANPSSTGANRFDIVFSKTNAPLPVRLINFTAKAVNEKNVQLNWSASEINTNHYVIEKMNKKGVFEPIASINAQNNSALNLYTYMDTQLDPGVNTFYYRLKMLDRDETSAFSDVVAVVFKNEQIPIKVFPNPSTGLIHIQFDNSGKSASQIEIINIFNQTMMTVDVNETGKITKTVDLSGLSKGVYFVKVNSSQQAKTVKINLQ